MMLNLWLDQPIWRMFLFLAAGFLLVVLLIQLWSFSPLTRGWAIRYLGVVPAYFSALAVLLALLTGFVASDTWERQRQAERTVQSEADNVLAVQDLSIATASDMSAIRVALHRYVDAVVTDEWPRMAQGASSSKASEALGALLQQVAIPRIATESGAPAQAALLNSVLRIRADRGTRLSLNQHRTDSTKWLVLIILGILTQKAIGIVHLERQRAQLAALLIFTAALVSTLGLIAIHEWPFDGPAAISPTALEAASARVAASLPPSASP